MLCDVCKKDNDRVVDSRSCDDGKAIRRRRACLSCGQRFTTFERAEASVPTVVKKDGRREPFQRDKILNGLRIACQKRPISIDQLTRMVDRLEADMFRDTDREVATRVIGERLIEELKSVDTIAYVRFASVYMEFAEVKGFMDLVMPLLTPHLRPPTAGPFGTGSASAGNGAQAAAPHTKGNGAGHMPGGPHGGGHHGGDGRRDPSRP